MKCKIEVCAHISRDESRLYFWPAAHARSLKRGAARRWGRLWVCPASCCDGVCAPSTQHPARDMLHPAAKPKLLHLETRLLRLRRSDWIAAKVLIAGWDSSSGITWLHFATHRLGGGGMAIMLMREGSQHASREMGIRMENPHVYLDTTAFVRKVQTLQTSGSLLSCELDSSVYISLDLWFSGEKWLYCLRRETSHGEWWTLACAEYTAGKLAAEAISLRLPRWEAALPFIPGSVLEVSVLLKEYTDISFLKISWKWKLGLCVIYSLVNFCCSHFKCVELSLLISIRAVLGQTLMTTYFGNLNGEGLQPWEVGK